MDSAKQAVESVTEGVKKPQEGEEGQGCWRCLGRPLELNPPPDFLQKRIELFDKLKKEYDDEIAKRPREPITITMPDGSVRQGTSYETTPGEIAKSISNSLYKRTVVARLDGDQNQLWDLDRPLEKSCKLELLNFDDEQGKQVFWHSSAHILGEACERRFGCSLCIGPPVDNGFYYEMALPGGAAVQASDWKPLESIVGSIVKEKQKFERLELTKEQLLEMFSYNKYKQHIINDKIPDGTKTTVYRNGPLIDLCRGPHVPSTDRIEAFSIMKNSASYFLGSQENDSLQRVYGVSFPSKKELAAHKKWLEEAAARDHRPATLLLPRAFPGSAMWLPHGARIYNTLLAYIKEQYFKRDYHEVISPNMYNAELWKISGHWDHYKDDMFVLDVDKEKFADELPGHCLMFAHTPKAYHQLPWRVADFGVLHRNEASGALSGLTRVRRFQQDDAHIFCREDQIKSEISNLFDFLREMYGLLGFTFKLRLSTRPEKYLGELETWNRAEDMLKQALDEFAITDGGVPWTLNEGDGAFYGPKIDIKIMDVLNREWQCATIQLDFQLPQNFGLEYVSADVPAKSKEEEAPAALKAPERPVIIHRAMAGSIERFTGILIEHFAGKWPFWLSPRQIMVIPVGKGFVEYAEEVQATFKKQGMWVDVDLSGNTLPKKIRSAQLSQYNFIFVVGDEEMKNKQVNIRYRDDTSSQDRGKPVDVAEAVEKLKKLREERGTYNPFPAVVKAAAKEVKA
ncbi:LOW QUALITY PROTEIN: threonyl-tRNA synthetase [Colletotrichum tofieldiae]|nr:LOW QUALITY PROTEIN: threonyl-tRNA synthetase [Colletotrichum tofieldiae]